MARRLEPGIFVGTAAWTIPKAYQEHFPTEGSHLERYAGALNAVEINTSFYRDHQGKTYERWAASVPENFRFAVKVSKALTHDQRLKRGPESFQEKWQEIRMLGNKLGALLVQLPPSLDFDADDAEAFFQEVRQVYKGPVAFEPRHPTWLTAKAKSILRSFEISRVIADPEPKAVPNPQEDFPEFVYLRLHGSPKIYQSDYEAERLREHANRIAGFFEEYSQVWCIYDNTTFGFATANALDLSRRLGISNSELEGSPSRGTFQDPSLQT